MYLHVNTVIHLSNVDEGVQGKEEVQYVYNYTRIRTRLACSCPRKGTGKGGDTTTSGGLEGGRVYNTFRLSHLEKLHIGSPMCAVWF